MRVGLRGYRTIAQRFGEAGKASSVRYQDSSPISAIDGVRNCLTSNLYAGSERPGDWQSYSEIIFAGLCSGA